MSDTTNTNGTRYVKIRTNIGWVTVPTLSSGGVDLSTLEEQVKALEEKVKTLEELETQIDNKLDKSDYLESSLVDEILANTEVE